PRRSPRRRVVSKENANACQGRRGSRRSAGICRRACVCGYAEPDRRSRSVGRRGRVEGARGSHRCGEKCRQWQGVARRVTARPPAERLLLSRRHGPDDGVDQTDGARRQSDSHQPGADHVHQIHHAGSWSQGLARFREREISGRTGRCRRGHAADLRRLKRPREGRRYLDQSIQAEPTHRVLAGCRGPRRIQSSRSIEHHRAALAPVTASTTMTPVMCGCSEQKYAYVPGVVNVKANLSSVSSAFDLKSLLLEVIVWGASSSLIQVTVVPAFTVMRWGTNANWSISTSAAAAGAG